MPNVVFRPRVSERTPSRTWFAELATAPGPQVIGQTGDNSFDTLFGREWLLEWSVEDDHLRLYQESQTHPGEWERVTADLPPVFDSPLPASARRVTFCFDQSARIVVAVEDEGVIKVTRWDPGSGQYVQNVTFAGVDPQLFMDATLADPAGFPEDVRAAAQAGVRVLFEWLPDGSWRESGVPDSDVVLFYLTADRTGVRARVQRQLFQTIHELHDYAAPVILDRVSPLPGAYQLLVSDATGVPREHALVSDPYIGDFLLAPAAEDELAAGVVPEDLVAQSDVLNTEAGDALAAGVTPEDVAVVGDTLQVLDGDHLSAGVAPEDVAVVGSTYPTDVEDELTAAVALETVQEVTQDIPANEEDSLDAGVALEAVRIQQTV